MAMTGGTTKLVKTSTTSAGTTLKLYVYYKTTQDIAANKSTVSCGMYITISAGSIGAWTDSNGSYLGQTTNTFTGSVPSNTTGTHWIVENETFEVSHNADGTGSATIYWKWGVNSSWGGMVKPSGSFTITLPTILRASSITSVSNITLGQECSVKWTPNSSKFKYKIVFTLGGWKHTTNYISPNTTSECTYVEYEILANEALLKNIPDSTTGKMTATLYTYNSSNTQIGTASSKTFTVTVPSSIKPTVGSIALTPVQINGQDILVQNKNRLTVGVSGCSAGAGSSIKSYTFSGPGISTITTSTSVTSSGAISKSGTLTYTVTVTDTRGRSASKTETIECYAWSTPSITFNAYRVNSANGTTQDNNGEYIRCTYTITYSSVNYTNQIKNFNILGGTNSVSYNDASTEVNDNKITETGSAVISGARSDTTYSIQATFEDNYSGSVKSSRVIVFSVARILNIRGDGNGIGIGKMAEEENVLDCAWKIKSNGFDIPEIQHGMISITPTAANTPTSYQLTFPREFSTEPHVVVTPHTTYPGTKVLGVGVYNRSKSGVSIYLTRTDTTATYISWIAMA